MLDPLNPLRVEDTSGGDVIESFSWLSLPGWSATSFVKKEHVQRDTLESRKLIVYHGDSARGRNIPTAKLEKNREKIPCSLYALG